MKITIQIDAVAQARPRFVKGTVIDAPRSKEFKEEFAWQVRGKYKGKPTIAAVAVEVKIYRNFKTATNKLYGDADNLAKGILDACNGILWADDSQIVRLTVEKNITDGNPRVELNFDEVF